MWGGVDGRGVVGVGGWDGGPSFLGRAPMFLGKGVCVGGCSWNSDGREGNTGG